ncbi:MAG: class I mannose-6-phosphate isomerase, partial [Muribaculaceae bacterium]|nr:class I mannose-6-phosphate isomerase [Muribaculaceae bacterium]
AEKNAKIYAGLSREMTEEDYLKKVSENTFADTLAVHDSNPGDVFFLPAGRVHAIGAGNLLAEIQESSDITYRIYDYNRKDAKGHTRELHTDLAKDAIDFKVHENYKNPSIPPRKKDCEVVGCEHFCIRRLKIKGRKNLDLDFDSFSVLMCIEGESVLRNGNVLTNLSEGKTVLLPAC